MRREAFASLSRAELDFRYNTRITSKGEFTPNPNVLDDKPEMAILIANIFAYWAEIERALGFLLIRILGADAEPAIAIFSVLTAQHLQITALGAAAKAALSPDDFDIFDATRKVAESVQSDRNRLAHWIWGECTELPGTLLLADPNALKDRDRQIALLVQRSITHGHDPAALENVAAYDRSAILVYRKADLENVRRDVASGAKITFYVQIYLDRLLTATPTPYSIRLRDHLLTDLCHERLFREAYDRIRADRKNDPPAPPG